MMKIAVSKLRKAKADRPELIVNGQAIVTDDGRTVIRYDIPADDLANNIGTVVSKEGKESQGVSLMLKPVEFAYSLDSVEDGKACIVEGKFICEPSWRGTWTALKVAEITDTQVVDDATPEPSAA